MWDFDRGLVVRIRRIEANRRPKARPFQGLGNETAVFVGVILWRRAAVLSRSLKAAGSGSDLRAERGRPLGRPAGKLSRGLRVHARIGRLRDRGRARIGLRGGPRGGAFRNRPFCDTRRVTCVVLFNDRFVTDATLVCWNVAGGVRRQALQAERVIALSPDIVYLQEVIASSVQPWTEHLTGGGLRDVRVADVQAAAGGVTGRCDARGLALGAGARRGGRRAVARACPGVVPESAWRWSTCALPISPTPGLARFPIHEAVHAHLSGGRGPRLVCGDLDAPQRRVSRRPGLDVCPRSLRTAARRPRRALGRRRARA